MSLPEVLASRLHSLAEEIPPELLESINTSPVLKEGLNKVIVSSDFIAQSLVRHADAMQELVNSGDLLRAYGQEEIRQSLSDKLTKVEDESALHQLLRRFRRREMVRIAWRDIAGLAQLNEVMLDLSSLADACVDLALEKLHWWQCQEMGTPCNELGEPQQMVVVGMGKLGAHELNYSSDIDLIFAFPEHGETRDGPRTMANEQFFTRLGQRLIQAIDQQTFDGFVFRVDMRLRPFGDSGPLALSFDGMEAYYTTHGREWERYAMVKARVIAGNMQAGQELMDMLRPFVYRRYLDYGAYENLREMKAMISREVSRKGMEDNVKLGPGGIREVEFIGQAFQLIRGGNERALQERRILRVLGLLQELDILPEFVVQELIPAYIFLRDSEHRLQQWRDEQTQMLPTDEEGQARLAYSMGCTDWLDYRQKLRDVMDTVHSHFLHVFEAPQAEEESSDEELRGVWQGLLDDSQAETILQAAGYQESAETYRSLKQFRFGRTVRTLSQNGQKRINRIMPMLLAAISSGEQPDITFARILGLLEKVASRSAYLALLIENPMALSQLVRLCASRPWLTTQLSLYPFSYPHLTLPPKRLATIPVGPVAINK
ncbi:MAG: bifunctional [glutamate--ammonia ligase]-adenylyl-L-tyrosine phosphorylase/[glutamate--ammonia-ligase] adenylyltransferase, partial [Gammaproteobacteria bacterium]|nr:bifunctional [glutamate--ammonia ligase]-adenylyl-L-tyrosine phosphorylase/[glutamate--ammonia-ligase] adenylyltransferase [Gammaproteobacteria bacterium]